MTQNQIAYWQSQYNYDIGKQQVAESRRSNLAREAELKRSNLAKENLQQLADLAKYGRTKYNRNAFKEIGESAEFLNISKELFDWVTGIVFSGLKAAGGKR